jgi:hypothetical protein
MEAAPAADPDGPAACAAAVTCERRKTAGWRASWVLCSSIAIRGEHVLA